MKVIINRYDPITKKKYAQCFDVPVIQDKKLTLMDVLDYISENLDSTISYYKHSVCNHGICGRCLLDVNGYTKLACLAIANEYSELILSPAKGRIIVKDLVTRK